MHDIRLIREAPEVFDAGLRRRGLDPLSARLIALDDARKAAISALQGALEQRNALSKEIGQAKAKKDEARAQELMAEVARLKERVPQLEEAQWSAEKALDDELAAIPNTPNPEVPEGADEHGNVERHRFDGSDERRARRTANMPWKQHFELGEALGLMDFEAAAKLSGSRFVVLRGQIARLERALGQFMIDLHTDAHGYTEVAPPLLVKDEVMFGTAQLPKFKDDQFSVRRYVFDIEKPKPKIDPATGRQVHELRVAPRETMWLIPTAEVPLTNLVRESILAEDELPLRFTALTPCFRAEAGAAGRDTRGMLRQHQFTKCELVSITAPEASAAEHERMLSSAEAVLQKLDLPYRVMTLCTGDMGFASAKTYDIEVWLPGQNTYREISSCSVCTDFQARRMNARYRPKESKGPRFVHTLNGSGTAVGRALIAVMENYQDGGGAIAIPAALQPYMGGLTRIEVR